MLNLPNDDKPGTEFRTKKYKDWKTMNRLISASAIIMCVFFNGCATVDFYNDEKMTSASKTGIPFYESKPYLLVARTGEPEKPVSISIIYLPDKSQKRYAKYTPGLGSHEFKIELADGKLSSYGQTVDSKVPETLSAVGSLATSLPGLLAALKPPEAPEQEAEGIKPAADVTKKKDFELYEIQQSGETTKLILVSE